MKESKYIIIRHSGFLAPIVFPKYIEHADMARGWKAISAGFVSFDKKGIPSVSGYSQSLKLNSKPEDAETIQNGSGFEDFPVVECPDALLPDGPICPRCGGRRGPSGIDGGSWVHFNS